MTTLKHYSLPLAMLFVAGILLASILWQRTHMAPLGTVQVPGLGTVSVARSPDEQDNPPVDWSMIGQAIAALISAIAGVVQIARGFFAKTASAPGGGGTLTPTVSVTPTAETLGDDLCAFTGQTGSGPAYELAMRVAGERLLAKYTITVKP